jgi:5-methyltetrahydropteroyltriglutamate--homocysteine methyltransferase
VATYRADQVGSLLRPPELLKARADVAEGKVDAEYLRYEEDRAILNVLSLQRQIGLDVVTDGEYRRGAWMTDMADSVDGFVKQSAVMSWKGPGGGDQESSSHVVGGKLKPHRRLTGDQAAFVKKHVGDQPFKITVPSPSGFMNSSYRRGVSDSAYPIPAEMLADLSAIVRDEIGALFAEGVPYVQMDTPQYSYYGDPNMTARMRDAGLDPEKALNMAIDADNAALAGIERAGVTVALHVCRGNSRSRWVAEGGYDAFADKLFNGLQVDRFLLEYDDPTRSGGFEPLRFVPDGKMVVLGLITTKTPGLESKDDLKRRVDEAARHIPLERLALSPQCGFASVAAGNLLDWDDQRRKLELVVEVARDIWS